MAGNGVVHVEVFGAGATDRDVERRWLALLNGQVPFRLQVAGAIVRVAAVRRT